MLQRGPIEVANILLDEGADIINATRVSTVYSLFVNVLISILMLIAVSLRCYFCNTVGRIDAIALGC